MKTADQLKIGLFALGALGLYLAWRKAKTVSVSGAATSLVTGAAHVAGDVVGGVVQGVASVVGVPATDELKCAVALANGHAFDASLYCPLPIFSTYVASGADAAMKKLNGAPVLQNKGATDIPTEASYTPTPVYDRVILNLEAAGGGIV